MEKLDEVKFLAEMLKIYSPSGKESEIASFLVEKISSFGFKASMDEAGNVIGTHGEGKPSILLCSHMDTVEGFIPIKIVNGFLYGRGAVDAKGPLAAMIMAAYRVLKKLRNGKITVLAVVEEEKHSKGIKHFIEKHEAEEFNYALFGEPSNLRNIIIGYKGSLTVQLTVETVKGHAASPGVRNAIEETINIIGKLTDRFSEGRKRTIHGSVTVKPVEIHCQDPSKCKVKLNIRVPIGQSTEETERETYKFIAGKCALNGVKAKAKTLDKTEPFITDKKSRLIKILAKSIEEITGLRARLVRKTGTGDMNIFGQKFSSPVVTYGPGDPKLDHTEKENIKIRDYLKSIDILELTLNKLCKTG